MTENGENSRKCHQNTQKYETKFLLKQSYLQNSENEENQSPEYSDRNEMDRNNLQNQFAYHFRDESVMLQNSVVTHSQHELGVGSFDGDVMMLQEDGSVSHQQMTVDDIKSMPLSQEDDILATAEAFEHTTSGGEGAFLHSQISASTQELGEFPQGKSALFFQIYKFTELFTNFSFPCLVTIERRSVLTRSIQDVFGSNLKSETAYSH
jgi:hypothetical protein